MSMQDPIADMLTRIRNAQAIGGVDVSFPASNLKKSILEVLKREGYVEGFALIPDGNKSNIEVKLRYYHGTPVIKKIQRVSRSGCRVYRGSNDLPVVNYGLGVAIVSTSKGVMTGRQAAEQKLGGEVLCVVE